MRTKSIHRFKYLLFLFFFRYDIDDGNYRELDKYTNIATVTSVLKLFLSSMPEPLIPKTIQQIIIMTQINFLETSDEKKTIVQLQDVFMQMDQLPYRVLKYILFHLKDVSEVNGNKKIM